MKRWWIILLIVILGVVTQAVGAQSSDVWITIQKFERGMMWWRSDNSTILVLSNQGQVKTFPAASYSSYRDNRITSSPTGRVPILGFGKVWGNFDSVRRMIGSPTTGEFGISTKISADSRGTIVAHADGQTYLIGSNNQWSFINGPLPQPSIRFFTATVDKIDGPSLRNGTARIYVEWAVDNRPANSNLVFEQVFPNGATKNVELPRTFPIVPSEGKGVVAPVMPPNSTTELVIQLRLISLNSSTVYYTRQIKFAIVESDSVRINQFTAIRSAEGPIMLNWDITGLSTARIMYIPAGGSTLTKLTDINSVKGTFVTTLEAKQFSYTLEVVDGAGSVRATASAIASLNKITQFIGVRNADNSITFTWDISGSVTTGRIAYGAPGALETTGTLTKITTAKGTFTTGTQETTTAFTLELFVLPEKVLDSVSISVPPTNIKINSFTGTRAADNSISFAWDVTGIATGRITYTDPATNAIATLTDITVAKGSFTTTTEAKDNTYTLELYKVPGTILASAQAKAAPANAPATFTVSPLNINEGGTVTVTWNVPGAQTVNIQMAHNTFPSGSTVIANGGDMLKPSGTLEVTVPSPLDQVTFMVMGTNLPTYTVDVNCNHAAIATGLTSCPMSASSTAPGVYQRFERGSMIWLEGMIWVLYDNGTAASYADTWDGVTLMAVEVAPSGMYQPDRGFGYLWSTNPNVRQSIGWATGPEQSYTVQKQAILPNYSSGEGRLISVPDGRIAYISSVNGSHSYLLLG